MGMSLCEEIIAAHLVTRAFCSGWRRSTRWSFVPLWYSTIAASAIDSWPVDTGTGETVVMEEVEMDAPSFAVDDLADDLADDLVKVEAAFGSTRE